jgi:amidase
VDPGVERVCRDAAFALAGQGVDVEEIQLDLSAARPAFLSLRGLWFVAQMFGRLEMQDRFGPNVGGNVRSGLEVTARELAAAESYRAQLWHQLRTLFEKYDHLLTPCVAVPPFPVEQNYPDTIAGKPMETYIDWIAPTFVLSLSGLPVACVPAGLDSNGMPVGLQIAGGQFGEEDVLALAAQIQRLRPLPRGPWMST